MVATSAADEGGAGTAGASPAGAVAARARWAALDGVRGLAVLIVVVSHLTNSDYLPRPGLLGAGKIGVYLFFALSAFLLTSALVARPPGDLVNARLWLNYALRRVLRIWPLYLVILLLSWGLTRAGVEFWPYPLDSAELAAHIALQQGKSVLWSIPVEFKFYAVLPLVAALLATAIRLGMPWWAEVALGVGALALVEILWPAAEARPNDVRLGPYLAVFLCGSFAARGFASGEQSPPSAAWGGAGLLALVLAGIAMPAPWSLVSGAEFSPAATHRWFIFFGVVWSVLIIATLRGPAWFRAPFEWLPLRLVGLVSYSMYLWHMPVVEAYNALGWSRSTSSLAALMAAIVIISAASYALFEFPLRNTRLGARKAMES